MTPIRKHLQSLIDAGYTQTKIASLSDVPQATISRILSSDVDPLSSTVEKLRKVKMPRRKSRATAEPVAA